jgi:GT2 family glycosyltransferase
MPDSVPEITLVICTCNRRESLSETLDTVAVQQSSLPWEVLVVDNNSTDGTSEMVAERAPGFPVSLRVEREERQGRSYALNRAIEAAGGSVLIFTDDDVNLRPGFIAAHADLYSDPEVGGGGGRIIPIMPESTPPWMLPMAERSGGLAGRYDFGDASREIDREGGMFFPFGANMSIRREVARELGGFRVDLGWGKTIVPGEEEDLFERVRKRSLRVMYQPEAVVEHRFQCSKATLAYFLQYEAGYGRSLVLMSEVTPLRRARWTCREAVNLLFFSVKAAIGPREMSVRIELLRERARARGKLAQLLGF